MRQVIVMFDFLYSQNILLQKISKYKNIEQMFFSYFE